MPLIAFCRSPPEAEKQQNRKDRWFETIEQGSKPLLCHNHVKYLQAVPGFYYACHRCVLMNLLNLKYTDDVRVRFDNDTGDRMGKWRSFPVNQEFCGDFDAFFCSNVESGPAATDVSNHAP